MENRHGLLVDACLTAADGHGERVAALHMIEPHADRPKPITLGADKGYDAADFVNELRSMQVTPHVAQNLKGSGADTPFGGGASPDGTTLETSEAEEMNERKDDAVCAGVAQRGTVKE